MRLETAIRDKLTTTFAPERLLLVNESHKHNVPAGSESHFNVIVVSGAFAGLSTLKRQRAVYACLDDELKAGVHALTMKTLTPDEWEAQGGMVTNPAPPCRGGSAHDP